MRTLILAAVAVIALVSCSQTAQTQPTHTEFQAKTVYSKVVEPDGTEKTFITFQPYSNARMACTYMKGQPSTLSCSKY